MIHPMPILRIARASLNLHNFSYFPRFEDFPDVEMCVVGEYYQIDLTIRVQGFSEDSGFEEAL
jgi:hypothetical protein